MVVPDETLTAPATPAEWLPVLAKMLDERHPEVRLLRRYSRGRAKLPEMGDNLKASWKAFQRKSRTDYGGAATRSLRNRIRPNGLRIGTTDDHPALAEARRILRDNRWPIQVRDAIRDYIEVGVGYLVVGERDGAAVITRERPERFYALPDPARPWKARATINVWRDPVLRLDFARAMCDGQAQTFARPSTNRNGSPFETAAGVDGEPWRPYSDLETFTGGPRVAILDRGNEPVSAVDDDEEEERVKLLTGAFLAPHLDTIDRILLGKLNRLVVTAMEAFRQRAIKPAKGKDGEAAEGLPDTDDDGNQIDWKKAFEPAPGALWELPVGVDIWESEVVDIRPLLEGESTDARDFCAESGTPISVLIPEGQNQSAEGAANAKEQQVATAEDDVERLKPALAVAVVYALEAEGVDLLGDTVEVLFAPPAHVSLQERFAAAVQAKGAGLSGRTIKRDILGMTPDQIQQDEADAGADLLAQALLGVGAGQNTGQQTQNAAQDATAAAAPAGAQAGAVA